MLAKSDLLKAMLKEIDICIHLYSKIPKGGLEYQPSSAQRNTRELLKYLSFCGIGFASSMVEGSWEGYQKYSAQAENLSLDDFPKAMVKQKEQLKQLFETITDEDIENKTAILPSGEKTKLSVALLDMPFRCLCGYRMQLFLYVKAAGNHEIYTPNCWFGIDAEPLVEREQADTPEPSGN